MTGPDARTGLASADATTVGFEQGLAQLARTLRDQEAADAALAILCAESRALLDVATATLWLCDGDQLVARGTAPTAETPTAARIDIVDAGPAVATAVRERRPQFAAELPYATLAVPVPGRGDAVLGVLAFHVAGVPPDRDRLTIRAELVAALAADAVERLRLTAALRACDDAVRAGERLQARFMALVSHEIRTPLNVVLGYLDLVLEEVFGGVTDELREVLERVHLSARELTDLVAATLDLGHLAAGQLPFRAEAVDLAFALHALHAEFAGKCQPGVTLDCELPDPPPDLVTDPEKLGTVLKNLVGNAVKFTSAGHVRVFVRSAGEAVAIHVEDTGIGIPQEHLDSIFEMFRQVDPPETRKHGGLGLGLWIVRRLVEDLGARMAVESRPGEGTTFRVILPLHPPPAAL